MNKLLRLYKQLNILSIDVALGAVCCGAWFAKVFNVQLRPYALITLGLTVWSIYTADHLFDALKVKHAASTERHRFHQKHFRLLAVSLVIVCVINLVMVFFIRAKVLHAGLILTAVVIMYLLVNHWLGFVKEFVIAVVYCMGVLLPALSLSNQSLNVEQVLLIISFLLTVLINLLTFSRYDVQADRQDGYNSFALRFGKEVTQKVLSLLFILQVMTLSLLFLAHVWISGGVILVMNAVLFLVFLKPTYFSRNDLYRLYGDAVFLFPAIFLLIG